MATEVPTRRGLCRYSMKAPLGDPTVVVVVLLVVVVVGGAVVEVLVVVVVVVGKPNATCQSLANC